MRLVRPDLLGRRNLYLLHDNARSHKPIIVHQSLASRQVLSMDDPLLIRIFLCPKLKLKMNGNQYESTDVIEFVVTKEIDSVKENTLQNAFTNLYTRAKHCIELG